MPPVRPLTPASPRPLLTALMVVLALALGGCGGDQVEYQEVPGAPAEITLPEAQPADPAATEDEAAAEDGAAEGEEPTPEPTPAATPEAGAGTSGTTQEPSTSQAEAPPTAEDGPDSDEPPVPGTDAERFEDFCEQNAGAC
jgi:hypothetical protein